MVLFRLAVPKRHDKRLHSVAKWLRPLDVASQEIQALDGVRALAALLVLAFHVSVDSSLTLHAAIVGTSFYFLLFYAQTGVQLFFVLSGFLLFRPYVRSMLSDKAWPSIQTFYKNRALRILPAYYACLVILVALNGAPLLIAEGRKGLLANVGMHLLLLHDIFPTFDKSIDGPFWTLAVEWQFYLTLPLIALVISRLVVRGSRSTTRLIAAVIGVLLMALGVRIIVALVKGQFLAGMSQGSTEYITIDWVLRVLMGTQGKYLEVFALGMLSAVLYVVVIERHLFTPRKLLNVSIALLVTAAVVSYFMALIASGDGGVAVAPRYEFVDINDWRTLFGPLIVGVGYATLVLGVLCGNRIIRAPFEFTPLRYIGLWSFSLYLWHVPVIYSYLPGTENLDLWARLALVFLITYASYQLIERPVMLLRKRSVGAPSQSPNKEQRSRDVTGASYDPFHLRRTKR